ncbi:MAG: cytochrome-c peroxidase [SAR86 cluster bacterium]|uniref:Cytochrome-c peroxidase n=1 Tax=SAR86 cluster bacterium TaxID=2030880 RepID=A0A2A5B6V0_9GAMM|nr:MAG: cytochrome-c peroxidase [SAR86 cluster bacterium]
MKKLSISVITLVVASTLAWNFAALPIPDQWDKNEQSLINSLSLTNLPALPEDPSNAVANNPLAAALGHRLYFDTRLSSNNTVACASCHKPELMFADGLDLAVGISVGPRHTPSLIGLAYSPWLYWDGRKDSQWSQALAPLEASHEHGSDRVQLISLLMDDSTYKEMYERVFQSLPEDLDLPPSASPLGDAQQQAAWNSMSNAAQNSVSRIFSNMGKAIAAYERKIIPGPSKFDEYADMLSDNSSTRQNDLLSNSEIAGLKLFIGKAQCVNCHNSPLFTNNDFHNTGVLAVSGQLPPMGRYDGVRSARSDPFNCLGEFSDATPTQCTELRFARDENDLVGAQKTPTLRNITLTAPYMHGGQLNTLQQVIEHYNDAPTSMLSHNEAKPLGLRAVERRQLESFLRTLTAPLATAEKWLSPPEN